MSVSGGCLDSEIVAASPGQNHHCHDPLSALGHEGHGSLVTYLGFSRFTAHENRTLLCRLKDGELLLDPVLADAYYYRGCAYDGLGEHGRAMKDFNTATSLDPGLGDT